MERTRILIAHQHPIIRGSIRHLLERVPSFHVIGEAADSHEALLLADFGRPHAVLLDMKLPAASGIAAARDLHARNKKLGIIFLSGLADEEYIAEALKAGARGYVQEDSAQADLVLAVQAVAGGRSFLSPSICAQLWESHSKNTGSERQKQFFCLLGTGYNDREIAYRLNVDSECVRDDWSKIEGTLRSFGMPPQIVHWLASNRNSST